ncbi:hypothetical protein [Tunicatimonas pelagia]|uniref:hypothetical protein n=1 Tax=Tunicatimonas pelagia TaxID=931531 RepID=UPI00266541B2|nr:hypothetical protein [Tunicatimonas pelagia]WKN46126.1 hypothetical protein P0M28_14320 [Tunicatimonas pelagia]
MKNRIIKYHFDFRLRNILETGDRSRRDWSPKSKAKLTDYQHNFRFPVSRLPWTRFRTPHPRIIRTGFVVLLLCLGIFVNASAQRPSEKIETARIAFLTERLSLTPETAQQFWPVYNQFDKERRELKKEEFRMRRSTRTDELNDEVAQQHIDEYFSLKERQLDLEKTMAEELSEVLSSTQMLQLIRAEADFQRMVLRKLGERRRGEGRRGIQR